MWQTQSDPENFGKTGSFIEYEAKRTIDEFTFPCGEFICKK
jgi:hypothetical protein